MNALFMLFLFSNCNNTLERMIKVTKKNFEVSRSDKSRISTFFNLLIRFIVLLWFGDPPNKERS